MTGEGGGRVGGRGGARPQSGGAAGRGAPAAAPRTAQHRRRPLHAGIPIPSPWRRAQGGRVKEERKEERGESDRGRAKLLRANAPSHPPTPPSVRRQRAEEEERLLSPSPAGAGVHESGEAEPAAPELSGVTSSSPRPPRVSPSPSRPPPPRAAAAAAGLVPPRDTLKEPRLHGLSFWAGRREPGLSPGSISHRRS
ncbi:uncharacterized protein ACIB01_004065 [Guaruba guarouba]